MLNKREVEKKISDIRWESSRRCLFIDIDGVLANISHRLKYIQGKKDYEKFYGAAMADDEPMWDNIAWYAEIASASGLVHFITGRPERTRSVTEIWINTYCGDLIKDDTQIFMRKDGDHRPSEVVKAGLVKDAYATYEKKWIYHEGNKPTIMLVDDDINNLVEMQKSLLSIKKHGANVLPMLAGLDLYLNDSGQNTSYEEEAALQI